MNGRRHRGGVLVLMLCSGLGTAGPAVAAPRLELVTRAGFPAPTPTAGVFPVAATPDGRWPPEPLAGVFNRTCAIHYDAYLRVFPPWALAACAAPDGAGCVNE